MPAFFRDAITFAVVAVMACFLTACGGGGGAESPGPASPSLSISFSASPIIVGQSATLTWSSTNASSCTASGSWSGIQASSGSLSLTPATGTHTYTLNCTGAGGSITASSTLVVGPVPVPAVALSVSPVAITAGQSATLTWSSTHAASCIASGDWSGAHALAGGQSVSPAAGSYSYTLSCTGAGGSSSSAATLLVSEPVPVVSISVSPGSITTGQGATVTWSSSHASACTASGAWTGAKSLAGSVGVMPAAGSHTYGLSCTGAGGTVANSASLVVAAPTGSVAVLAGKPGNSGHLDGSGQAARFNAPFGLAIDSADNVYVADMNNNTIRKITPAGVVSTFAGMAGVPGSADGAGSAASFNHPSAIAIDNADNLYVTDALNNTIRKITPAGAVSTLAGTAGAAGSADGTGALARFYNPGGIAVDSANNLYVADSSNNTIRKITPAGQVTTLAGTATTPGSADGTGPAASFNTPVGIALDTSGNVYVADSSNSIIRKITAAGVVTTFAGSAGVVGSAGGPRAAASFKYPLSLIVDNADNLFVADSGNHTIRKIAVSGTVTTVAGIAGSAGIVPGPLPTSLNYLYGIVLDSAGVLYVTSENAVIKVDLP